MDLRESKMGKKIILKEWQIVMLLFLLALIIRLCFMSTSPNFWDSAEYLTKVKELVYEGKYMPVSMSHNKPVYIILGGFSTYIYYWIIGIANIEQSLIILSVIFGSLSIAAMYYLAKHIGFSKKACLISALLFCFTPLSWWFSEEALTDIPGMFFLIIGLAFLFKWYHENILKSRNKLKWLVISCLVTGLGLLIRFANIFIISVYIIVIGFYTYRSIIVTSKKAAKRYTKTRTLLYFFKIFLPMIIIAVGAILLPLIGYLTIEKARYPELGLRYYFNAPENTAFKVTSLIDKFNLLGTSYYIINGTTLTLTIFALMAIICFFIELKKRFDNKKTVIFFSLCIWFLTFATYYTGIYARPISRYLIPAIPPLILLASWFIVEKKDIMKRFWAIFIVTIPFDLLINYINISEIYYGKGVINALIQIKDFLEIRYILISSFIIIGLLIIINDSKYSKVWFLRGINNDISYKTCAIIIIVLVLHAYPLLNLIVTKTNYQKAIAVWYQQNTPNNALIIGGQELPFDIYYSAPRKAVWYKPILYHWEPEERSDYTRVYNEITSTVDSEKRVFTSSDRYIKPLLTQLKNDFNIKNSGLIAKENLRNQYDWGAIFMNYASMSKADDIEMYEITKKI